MTWQDIKSVYTDQWLIIEAIEAHTTPDAHRILDRIAVIDTCADGSNAMQRYRELHKQHPQREFYFVSARRKELDIRVKRWLGIRGIHATPTH